MKTNIFSNNIKGDVDMTIQQQAKLEALEKTIDRAVEFVFNVKINQKQIKPEEFNFKVHKFNRDIERQINNRRVAQ